jgi:hypothetical protein
MAMDLNKVTVTGFKKCSISDEMDGREDEESGKLAVNMKEDGNCEDNKAGRDDWNGKIGGAGAPEERLLTLRRKQIQCHG